MVKIWLALTAINIAVAGFVIFHPEHACPAPIILHRYSR